MISVQNLTKYFGQVMAIDRVSFEVDRGEVVGFLGPNGAGKSTTMRILTSYLPATSGIAKVAGFDVVFATSIEQSEIPFGDDILGAKLRGFDRPFLRSLASGASAGKVVLGEVLRDDGAILARARSTVATCAAIPAVSIRAWASICAA